MKYTIYVCVVVDLNAKWKLLNTKLIQNLHREDEKILMTSETEQYIFFRK